MKLKSEILGVSVLAFVMLAQAEDQPFGVVRAITVDDVYRQSGH